MTSQSTDFEFSIARRSRVSRGRIGIIRTPHGEIETPAFVPVATNAVIKTLASEEVAATGSQLLIANTFHLHAEPGERIVRAAGGIHAFMRWRLPLMTDSGGFQVFSFGFGKDYGTGKLLKRARRRAIRSDAQPKNMRITNDGVTFIAPRDGRRMFLGPRESVRIQEAIGADIIFAFDECTSPVATRAYTIESLARTHRWAELSLRAKRMRQAMYGIVQGGKFTDLRIASARAIAKLPFDGFGIGGEFGDDKRAMTAMLRKIFAELPEDKPRHLLGIGHPDDIPKIIAAGVDTFDCTAPTHYARRGVAFTASGNIELWRRNFLNDRSPVDRKCPCAVCENYTRSYLCHLLRAKEITALKFLTFHNLSYFNRLVADIRAVMKRGKR